MIHGIIARMENPRREPYTQADLRWNVTFNLLDGGFWGFGLGFASFVSILPLFVGSLTRSAVLIGLIPAIQTSFQQLPQLFFAHTLSRQSRYKPLLQMFAIFMRLPFLGLAILAVSGLGEQNPTAALIVAFSLLVSLGAASGMTNAVWLPFIREIIPGRMIGSFVGVQSATANLLSALAAVLAAIILSSVPGLPGFGICFFLAFLLMTASLWFLSRSRERPHRVMTTGPGEEGGTWYRVRALLRADSNFRAFLIVRFLLPFSGMAFAFYSVFAVWERGMDVAAASGLGAVLMGAQVVANPILGWLGDRWSHRMVLSLGVLAGSASAVLAVVLPGVQYFGLVLALAGVTMVSSWTTVIALTMQFGSEENRPLYIAMSNTLTAPGVILAPLAGGFIADTLGYEPTFLISAGLGIFVFLLVVLLMREPTRAVEA